MLYDKRFSDIGISNYFGRLPRIRKKLKEELDLNKNDVVLDIGCNKGELVEFLKPFCRQIYGIDINQDAIKSSRVSNLKIMNAAKTSFPANYFSKIVSSMTIEHIEDIQQVFWEINRILKKGGVAVLHYPWELYKGMGTMRNAWILFGNPFLGHKLHVNKLNHKIIGKLLKDTQLAIIKKSFMFDPWPGYITVLQKL